MATPGVVVLTRERSDPWVARWRDVRCAQDGVASIKFEAGRHDPLLAASMNECRVECVSTKGAARLRASLRAVGILVDGGGDDGDAAFDDVSDGDAPLPPWLETAAREATAPPERRNCLRERCKDAPWRRQGDLVEDGDVPSPGSTPRML